MSQASDPSLAAPEAPPRADLPATDAAMRAALVRRAMDLLGTTAYADAMGVADRTARAWAKEGGDPARPVTDRLLRQTKALLVTRRQDIAALVRGLRMALGEGA